MLNSDIRLSANNDIRVFRLHVGKQVERKHDAAIGAVFKRYDAAECGAGLDRRKDVFDGHERGERDGGRCG